METLVVNLFAGSGAGKSTNAARLFAWLKDAGIESELVTEYAKGAVWENRKEVFNCQPYIFGKQLYALTRLNHKVQVIITDSPILLSGIYMPEKNDYFIPCMITEFNRFHNLNFFLRRVKPFSSNGRWQNNVEESIEIDKKVKQMLYDCVDGFITVDGSKEGCKIMYGHILDELQKLNSGQK